MRSAEAQIITGQRRRAWFAVAGLLRAALATQPAACGQCTPSWSSLDGGLLHTSGNEGECRAISSAGANATLGRVTIAGFFSLVGGRQAGGIADWDGWTWSSMGQGFPTKEAHYAEALRLLAPPGSSSIPAGLYAAGHFTAVGGVPAANLARWTGSGWAEVGGGVDWPTGYPIAFALREYDADGAGPGPMRLYVGGQIYEAGGLPIKGIASWDGITWSDVGGGLATATPNTQPTALALEVFDDDGVGARPPGLYVGGSFTLAGGVSAADIARWDGARWEPLGAGTSSGVVTIAVFQEPHRTPALYAGGPFNFIGGVLVRGLGRWDGATWSAVPGWTDGSLFALAVHDDDGPGQLQSALFAGGHFTSVAGLTANHIARWDGQSWSPLNGGVSGQGLFTKVDAMGVFDEDGPGASPGGLYVGGYFTHAGAVPSVSVARWGCPLPASPCYPDCDASGTLTLADFPCFQTKFVAGDPYADCNGIGGLTVADFGCFQTQFVTGCP